MFSLMGQIFGVIAIEIFFFCYAILKEELDMTEQLN